MHVFEIEHTSSRRKRALRAWCEEHLTGNAPAWPNLRRKYSIRDAARLIGGIAVADFVTVYSEADAALLLRDYPSATEVEAPAAAALPLP